MGIFIGYGNYPACRNPEQQFLCVQENCRFLTNTSEVSNILQIKLARHTRGSCIRILERLRSAQKRWAIWDKRQRCMFCCYWGGRKLFQQCKKCFTEFITSNTRPGSCFAKKLNTLPTLCTPVQHYFTQTQSNCTFSAQSSWRAAQPFLNSSPISCTLFFICLEV